MSDVQIYDNAECCLIDSIKYLLTLCEWSEGIMFAVGFYAFGQHRVVWVGYPPYYVKVIIGYVWKLLISTSEVI